MIIRYRCDRPMAEKKGVLQYCDRRCRECLCAIKIDEWGREEHNGDLQGGSSIFTARNIDRMSGRKTRREILSGEDRTGYRGRPISSGGKRI